MKTYKSFRFYPISEIQKLNGFNKLSQSTILDMCCEIEEALKDNNNVLTLNEWQFLADAIKFKFSLIANDKDIRFLMPCYLFDVAYDITDSNCDKKGFLFKPKNDTDMYIYATNKVEKYNSLYNNYVSPEMKQIQLSYVESMKEFFNANYHKIHDYFGVTREQTENYNYEDWAYLDKQIRTYNRELKDNNKPTIKFNNNDKGKEVKAAHRPNNSNNIKDIKQIDVKTNEIIKVYSSVKEVIELNEGYTKSGLSKALSGKRSKYKGYIWKSN